MRFNLFISMLCFGFLTIIFSCKKANNNQSDEEPGHENVIQIASGTRQTFIIKSDHTLRACGSNEFGELGDGTNINRLFFAKVANDMLSVFTGYRSPRIIRGDLSLWASINNYHTHYQNLMI